ncbi:MAG: T9SS type A sorting domain-containing protein [Chitinophagales bacterium]
MKTIYTFFMSVFISVFFATKAFSQAPEIEWQNTIGGNYNDYLQTIQQTVDGGYIMGGFSYSDLSGDKTEALIGTDDFWVVKINSTGNIEWQNTIGGNSYDELYSVQQTSDDGYILGGRSYSGLSGDKTEASAGGWDYWVVKLNSAGDIEWQNAIGGSGDDNLWSAEETADGGYILGGYSTSGISGDKTEASLGAADYWVVKLDNIGNIEWQNTIGGSNTDYLVAIHQIADGGYILGGYSISTISGDKTEATIGVYDFWVLKLNATGSILWQNTIGGNSTEYLRSIQQTSDGGYILGGSSYSGVGGDKTEANFDGGEFKDYWVVKLNSNGNVQWQNAIGAIGDDAVGAIGQTSDGGYIIGGYSTSGISGDKSEASLGNYDYWVLKLNAAGIVQWQNTIGGSSGDYLNSIQQTGDGGFILGGHSYSGISGDKTEAVTGGGAFNDYWIVKLYGTTPLNSIVTNAITPLNYFQNGTVSIPYTATGTFNAGNIFTAQLSDASGSFSSPTAIGSLSSTLSGIINGIIPLTTPPGSAYRIRVVSANPNISGTDNGQNITINALTCDVPDGQSASNITSSSAKLYWNAKTAANKYKVRYRVTGTTTWTKISANNNLKKLTALSAATPYDWQVESICNTLGLGISTWSSMQNFTTNALRLSSEEEISFNVYPNPVTSFATITFTLHQPGNVLIRLFSVEGKELMEIANENFSEGNHTVNFPAGTLAAGIYFVQLNTDQGVMTKKVMVD